MVIPFKIDVDFERTGICQYLSTKASKVEASARLFTKAGRDTLQTEFFLDGKMQLIAYSGVSRYSEEGLSVEKGASLYAPWRESDGVWYAHIGQIRSVAFMTGKGLDRARKEFEADLDKLMARFRR